MGHPQPSVSPQGSLQPGALLQPAASAQGVLREVFGYEAFRGPQQAIVEHVIDGGLIAG